MKGSWSTLTLLAIQAALLFELVHVDKAQAANDLITPPIEKLQPCARKLSENFAIRHRVTLPSGGSWRLSCSSGGPGSCHAKRPWRFSKAQFVAAGGLGNPDNFFIEAHQMIVEEQSGGAGLDHSHDAGAVFGTAEVSKGWFGGGQTVQFRVTATLKETTSDATAAVIGRMCSALVFSPGEPN